MVDPQRITVFVYGTLMRGQPSHHLLGDAQFLGRGQTARGYDLLAIAWYPGLVRGTGVVRGELYSISKAFVAELDRYEGHPDHFTRTQLELSTGESVTAYVFNAVRGEVYRSIPDGCWRGWVEFDE